MPKGWRLEPSPSQRHCRGTLGLRGAQFDNHSQHICTFKSEGPQASLSADQAHPESPGSGWRGPRQRPESPRPGTPSPASSNQSLGLTGTEARVPLPKPLLKGKAAPQLQVLTLPGHLLCAGPSAITRLSSQGAPPGRGPEEASESRGTPSGHRVPTLP